MKKIIGVILCVCVAVGIYLAMNDGEDRTSGGTSNNWQIENENYYAEPQYNYDVPANAVPRYDYSFSNDPSLTVEPVYGQQPELCGVCYGLGSCNICDGTGRYSNYGTTSDCNACKGSGDCWKCGGTGSK